MLLQDFTIEYNVTESPTGTTLRIWERRPRVPGEEDSYLYQMNYTLSADTTPCDIINQLLAAAGANQLSTHQFSMLRGKLKVIRNPTLRFKRNKVYEI